MKTSCFCKEILYTQSKWSGGLFSSEEKLYSKIESQQIILSCPLKRVKQKFRVLQICCYFRQYFSVSFLKACPLRSCIPLVSCEPMQLLMTFPGYNASEGCFKALYMLVRVSYIQLYLDVYIEACISLNFYENRNSCKKVFSFNVIDS